jgi:hypothetical protein
VSQIFVARSQGLTEQTATWAKRCGRHRPHRARSAGHRGRRPQPSPSALIHMVCRCSRAGCTDLSARHAWARGTCRASKNRRPA